MPPPHCLPQDPWFRPDAGGRAEERVWRALHEQLPEDALLVQGLALTADGVETEADVVVALPGVGLAILEVKAGKVERHDGTWFQSGRLLQRSPVTQAQDVRKQLHRWLRARGVQQLRSAHLLALPDTDVPAEWEAPDLPRRQLLDRGDLPAAARLLAAAVAADRTGTRPLTPADVQNLAELLGGELGRQQDVLAQAADHEAEVARLTQDQCRVLDQLRLWPSVQVIGGAGTGKTWLALEQARRLSRAGQRVALVCYSRGLARFFQRITAEWPRQHQPAYVGLFHGLPITWGATSGADDDSDYWERRLPLQLGELAASRPREDLFDAVVVDEAQDFSDVWWPSTVALLRDPARGLFVFLDQAQRVFAREGTVPLAIPPLVLDENIRNTKRITQVFGSLTPDGHLRARGLLGPPVRFVTTASEAAVAAADDIVDELLDVWQPHDVALLTTHRRHPEQAHVVEVGGWDAYWDAFFDDDSVFYGHVLGFKGLERPVVVLAINGFRDPSRAREMLYVGLSRARTQLVVLGNPDLIRQVGGEGVWRRLVAGV